MRSKPIGVTTVGILTIFSALIILYSSLWGVFFGTESYVLAVAGFGVLVLIDAISILSGVRFGWHLSIVVWILMFIFLCVFYYFFGLVRFFGLYFIGGYPDFDSIRLDFVLVCPFLYVIVCLLYFQKRHVKEFFGINEH